MDLLGQRRVLDELDEVVLEDHRPGRDGGVAAHLEGVHVGLADQELALAAIEVGQHHLEAAHEVFALLLDGRLEHLRVQREEVGRVHRLDELPGIERGLAPGLGVHVADGADRVLDPARGQQVGLLEILEERVLAPLLVGEALVGLHHVRELEVLDRVLRPEPLQHRVLEQLLLRRPELDGHVGDLLGVVPHGPVELGEGRPGVQRVGPHGRALLHLVHQEPLPDLTRDVEDLGHVVRDLLALLGQRLGFGFLVFAHRVPPSCPRPACGGSMAPILQARPEYARFAQKESNARPAPAPRPRARPGARRVRGAGCGGRPGLGSGPRGPAAAPGRDGRVRRRAGPRRSRRPAAGDGRR